MKHLFLLLYSSFLFSQSVESCYSIQLNSFCSKKDFNKYEYPDSCKLVHLTSIYTVRCGCFENYDNAQKELHKLSKIYFTATIVDNLKIKKRADGYDYENDNFYKRYNKNIDSYDNDFLNESDEATLDDYGYK